MEPEDLRIKKGKSLTVLNTLMYPVVANEVGQTLGGQKFGKVSASDNNAKRAVEKGWFLVIS